MRLFLLAPMIERGADLADRFGGVDAESCGALGEGGKRHNGDEIVPVVSSVGNAGATFTHTVPKYSIQVLDIDVN